MKTKIGYKVVSHNLQSAVFDSKSISFLEKTKADEFRVQYKVGEFVEPVIKNSCLFCFTRINDARLFSTKEGMLPIYKCEFEPKKYKTIPLGSVYDVLNFWKTKLVRKKKMNNCHFKMLAPFGTNTAKRIKLLERVF